MQICKLSFALLNAHLIHKPIIGSPHKMRMVRRRHHTLLWLIGQPEIFMHIYIHYSKIYYDEYISMLHFPNQYQTSALALTIMYTCNLPYYYEYRIWCLIVRSHKCWKMIDIIFWSLDHCCQNSYQIPKRNEHLNTYFHGFETPLGPTIRRLVGYWNLAQNTRCTSNLFQVGTMKMIKKITII